MGLELVHHFRRQAWNVDGTASGQTQEHITNLFGHIDGHVFLRFFGRSPQVRSQNQPLFDLAQRRIGGQGLLGINVKGRAGNHPRCDGLSQRRLIDDAAPGAVH